VYVAVDSHRGVDPVVALHATNRNRDVVDHAESFAVVGEGVVKSASNADRDLIRQCLARGEDRSASRQPERVDQVARIGNLHLHFFARAERAGGQLVDVFGLVDEKNVLISGWPRFEEVRLLGNAALDQAIANAAVFFGGEDVLADRQIVRVAVDELERKHSAVSTPQSRGGCWKTPYDTRGRGNSHSTKTFDLAPQTSGAAIRTRVQYRFV
jgi:hypothetical protein